MSPACSLCGSGFCPDARSYQGLHDEKLWNVCVPCCLRVATVALRGERRELASLWLWPEELDFGGLVDTAADESAYDDARLGAREETRALLERYGLADEDALEDDGLDDFHTASRLDMLEDTLLDAATAYTELEDPEMQQEALSLLFGLLRDDAIPRLRALLYPV